jgi:glyceraldehyde 3-phosphate dehydrogenase
LATARRGYCYRVDGVGGGPGARSQEVGFGGRINDSLKTAAEGDLDTILEYCDEPLVFSDFRGNPASSIVDGLSTVVLDGKMAKVLAWYDNEWGYSCRVGDLATFMAEREL